MYISLFPVTVFPNFNVRLAKLQATCCELCGVNNHIFSSETPKEKPKEKEKKPKTAKGLPAVPESVLKHRKRRDASRKTRLQSAIKKKAEVYRKRKDIFKRAEQYVREYRQKERDEIRLVRQAKNRGNYYIPGEAKLAFVVRIRG